MSAPKKTHHIFKTYIEGANGQRSAPIQTLIHVSRRCDNCTHDGLQDAEWLADGGIEKHGRCINDCGAADLPDEQQHFCHVHQTAHEFRHDVHRPETPVLNLIVGGVASC